jgi:hypothetical protein
MRFANVDTPNADFLVAGACSMRVQHQGRTACGPRPINAKIFFALRKKLDWG